MSTIFHIELLIILSNFVYLKFTKIILWNVKYENNNLIYAIKYRFELLNHKDLIYSFNK